MVAVDLDTDNLNGRNLKCRKRAGVDNENTVDKDMGQSLEEDDRSMDRN